LILNSVYIIAEAGVNHNGSIELAKKLIDVAAQSGVDAVKFQSFKADSLVSKTAEKAQYQKIATGMNETQHEMLKKLELDFVGHTELINYCHRKKIQFLSTPFDCDSAKMLDGFGMSIFKIPSGEITNLPYLRFIGSLRKEIILSTGMSDLKEVGDALSVLEAEGIPRSKITVLHATTEYPCPIQDVNLNAMLTIGSVFGVKVGYSDHTSGIEVPIAAVALGACVIEKHFTLDRTMDGPDHKASLEPSELKAMVIAIRNIEQALGDGIKQPSPSELKNIPIARKSLVALRDIKKGELFCNENLGVKRPGHGISPMRWDELIGEPARRDFAVDEQIDL
jgi:N,N'-diacetyllegionaminate synthase